MSIWLAFGTALMGIHLVLGIILAIRSLIRWKKRESIQQINFTKNIAPFLLFILVWPLLKKHY
jgi:hypothetical protein